ncbi:MAG TPA: succinate dehydrogenase, cytochrome b556 subunit [Caulobacteraceae bacterium]|jgi:succinate dehydrogenase / fumarate reductase cytochrome b subunit
MAESSPTIRARPTSPHLQVWRWHLTLWASILHRAAGMVLYLGALLLALWALELARGAAAFAAYTRLFTHWPGRALLMLITLSAFYHLANGIRHFFWDMGKGFAVRTANLTAAICFGFAILATLMFWWRLGSFGAYGHG